jgi:copper resistance protein B
MKTLLALTLLAVATNVAAQEHGMHDNAVHSLVQFNRLEVFEGRGFEWQGQAWVGTDTDKLWLRSEGERVDERTHASDLEVMYGRPVSPWWELLVGVRHDFKPGASQDWAAIGIVGTAPYKIHVEATAYIGPSGRTAARIEAEYDVLLTNRLILQPLVELNAWGEDDPARGIDAGSPTLEAGLRLRYEVNRQFAPYVGIVHDHAFGGDAGSDTRVVAGVRVWF